jgi:tetratricopeptide (TPR) repeat protein
VQEGRPGTRARPEPERLSTPPPVSSRPDEPASLAHRLRRLASRVRPSDAGLARRLLERYEALGEEPDYFAAKTLYERALERSQDVDLLLGYGYLLECHGRNELRRALASHTRAIELHPDAEKPRWQLIGCCAGLLEPERAVAFCEQRFAAAPHDLREHRFLATAYLYARRYDEARAIVSAGLALAPDDANLIAVRGELRAAADDAGGALADWRRALDLDPEDLGPLYSSAFLLEREGRLAEAAETWRSIAEWHLERGFDLQAEWPIRELERLRRQD